MTFSFKMASSLCTLRVAYLNLLVKSSTWYRVWFATWCLGTALFLGVYRGIATGMPLFEEMLSDGSTRPDKVTLVSALTASARLGSLGLGRKIHGLVLGSGFALDVFLGSSLIDMYAKCGRMDDARKVFDRVPHRNVVSWTSMIAGYTQSSSFKDAIELFREMQLGVEADAAMVACVISACGHSGALDHGR